MLTVDLTEDAVEVTENFALEPLVLLISGAPHGQQDRCMWHATLWDHVLIEPEVTSSMGATLGRAAFRVNERSLRQTGGGYEINAWTRLGRERRFLLNFELEHTQDGQRDELRFRLHVRGTKSLWLFGDQDPVRVESESMLQPAVTFSTSTAIAVNERLQTVTVGPQVRPTAWERLEAEDE